MTKDNSFELIPGVRVTEASDIEYNKGKRLDVSVYKQFDRELNGRSYSEQQVLDKLGKNNGWAVCRSWTDTPNKQFCFEILINAKDTAVKTVSFEAACKDYGWKSFKLSDDGQTVLPKK